MRAARTHRKSAPVITLPALPADLSGRRVLVLGLGESGLAMARWAAFRGATLRVADTRAEPPGLAGLRAAVADVEFVAGPFAESLLDAVDLVAWSPGLSIEIGPSAEFHRLVTQRELPVAGELDLFTQALTALGAEGYRPRLVGVTGTNGKTTVTRLVGHLCEAAGLSVAVAGNISPALLDSLREAVAAQALPEVWVIELSSFQLALSRGWSADAAAILNMTQDHLDWHAATESYLAAKQKIFAGVKVAVYNRDDAATRPPVVPAAAASGATALSSFGSDGPAELGTFGLASTRGIDWLAEGVRADDAPARRGQPVAVAVRPLMPAEALRIRGRHNQMNALAALALCRAIGVPMAGMLHALREYAGEPHRCQPVAVIRDVEYVDDSKGTNVGATVAALAGLGRRVVLIAGGDGKGQDFAPLAAPVRVHARAVMLIGRDAPRMRAALADAGVPLVDCANLPDAVRQAAAHARTGDAVLLSPACASFDMFRNYGHRAEVFVAAVRDLAEEAGQP